MKKSKQFRTEGLAKVLYYVLAVRPDEFCLVPDGEGFVPIKDLLQALHEEAETAYVRESHIREVLLGENGDQFELRGSFLRAVQRRWELASAAAEELPKILYTPIRRRAHPVVAEKGLIPSAGRPIIFSNSREKALRIGKRRDKDPVILEITTRGWMERVLFPFGDLFLCREEIQPRFVVGPPLPKERLDEGKDRQDRRKKDAPAREPEPGSFFLDLSRDVRGKAGGRKQRGWKEEARKIRREKARR
jgi:putative RNA 2'-phosphotransferase